MIRSLVNRDGAEVRVLIKPRAMAVEDGGKENLAVLGMFIKTGASHPEIEKICKHLSSISIKDMTVSMEHISIDPTQLLPANKTFFTYPGSLTTPPLFESVTWLVFK